MSRRLAASFRQQSAMAAVVAAAEPAQVHHPPPTFVQPDPRHGLRRDDFGKRHIGPSPVAQTVMLNYIGFESLDEMTAAIVPEVIQTPRFLEGPEPCSEYQMLEELAALAQLNAHDWKSYIGLGYYNTIVPPAIQRNVLENAGWVTQYTPYQAEISQGRLECLLNFQTMVADLTGLSVANASLLDEATAAAEAMTLCFRASNLKRPVLIADKHLHPQSLALLHTRSKPLGMRVEIADATQLDLDGRSDVCGVLLQYPDTSGEIIDFRPVIDNAHANGALVGMACDLLASTMLTPPGELGADMAFGSAQRFGVPLGYGGPHAAFFAVSDRDKGRLARSMPGRLVGVTKDANGRPAYRLALQTREQHIRRDKATSNICTAQALLANISALYAMYHGPDGLRRIADNVHRATAFLASQIPRAGHRLAHSRYFDTLKILPKDMGAVRAAAAAEKVNLRFFPDEEAVGISLDETVGPAELAQLMRVFGCAEMSVGDVDVAVGRVKGPLHNGHDLVRRSHYLQHPNFHMVRSETELMRYVKKLENKDLSLTHSMIPLGSCTMKLNPAASLNALSTPELTGIHPFVPLEQAKGYHEIIRQLGRWLCDITGYDGISFQPNSGAQGEYAGLLAIRHYLDSIGHSHRRLCLVPTSAHGTNPASANMAGMKILPLEADKHGNMRWKDVKAKVEQYGNDLAAIMVTYPSTHGVFEDQIAEICGLVHQAGGQVYLDGANMNAQVGLCRPGEYGSDVSHLNLHKTFSIPHGGGGPGMGPIGVRRHLIPHLPSHPLFPEMGGGGGPVSAAPFGSASILAISWAYIRMMGGSGLTKASQVAILNANYMMNRLAEGGYKVLYRGISGHCAHEFILDCREFRHSAGVEVVDIAKRLMDYGFHAPTMSWPVAGCLMVEPTESESKAELDRFCDAMIGIREEIRAVEEGKAPREGNLLKMAPHTQEVLMAEAWERPYTRQEAAFPMPHCTDKLWPSVGRVDDSFGDRNLFCTCPPVEAYL